MIEIKNEYEVRGNVTAIFLRRKDGTALETLIDTENLPIADSFPKTWYAHENKSTNSMYVFGTAPRATNAVLLHRLLLGNPEGMYVDHINHNTLDNRKENLRITTPAQNNQNRSGPNANSKSGVRGVYWNKRKGKWLAQAKVGPKRYNVGYFDDLNEARKAVEEVRAKYMPFSKEALDARD